MQKNKVTTLMHNDKGGRIAHLYFKLHGMSNPLPQIFLSYAWANTSTADAIDDDFKAVGISFIRDVRDLGYRQSIKEFMHRVGKSDYVLMIISDEYLRSINCMYEVMELLNTHELEKRIIPLRLANANMAFSRKDRKVYYDYWKAEMEAAKAAKLEHDNDDTYEQHKRCSKIYEGIGDFLNRLIDINVLPFETLKEKNYKPILDLLGIEEDGILETAISIDKIDDAEEKDLAIEAFLLQYPNSQYGLFLKAHNAANKKEYKKAKTYYLNLIASYPNYDFAHYNLALLLEEHFKEYEVAKIHYTQAVTINPLNDKIHYNLALLLQKHFKNYEEAKIHYTQAITINPSDYKTNNNLAALLRNDYFKDYEGAKAHFFEAITINPNYYKAHCNLAILLENNFHDYKGAKKHYLQAIAINPNYDNAHYNLAFLLVSSFDNITEGKLHYTKAVELNDNLITQQLDELFGISRYHS